MRAIGVDPGSRVVAFAALDVSDRRIEYVSHADFDLGEDFNDAAIRRASDFAARFIFANGCGLDAGYSPDVVITVERILRVYPREGFASGMATSIADSQWIGGEIARAARTLLGEKGSDRVGTCGGIEWRKALVKHKATDADVAQMISGAIRGWPKRSNAHVRDAAGCALFGARRWTLAKAATRIHGPEPEDVDRSFPSGPYDAGAPCGGR